MKKVIAYILYLCIIVGTAFSVTIKTEQDVPVQDPAGNDVYKGDQISLHLVPPESYNFGITTSSYALTAEHMEEDIILDPVENGRQISSVLNSENKNLFVFYRVYGDDSFDLSFRLSGPLVGYFENANKLDWGVKWHDDNNVLHELYSNNLDGDNGYILTYERPEGSLGGHDILRIDDIAIIPTYEWEPDLYEGYIYVTLKTKP